MRYLKLIRVFIKTSAQETLMYRANFWVSLLHAFLNLIVAVLALVILFGQTENLNGWNLSSTLSLLGVYLIVSAIRNLFIGPSLEALVGLGQEVWNGQFDFTLLRPVNTQFLITFRIWRLFSLIDLFLGCAVFLYSIFQAPQNPNLLAWLLFLLALAAGILILYAILLAFTALVFWNPGYLFTWVFDAIFQLARYPLGIYPLGVRIFLTWIIPVGVITTIPAQVISGQTGAPIVFLILAASVFLFLFASWLFNKGIKQYHSASS